MESLSSGVYMITNKVNGKIYIGQSTNVFKRWNSHFLESRLKDEDMSIFHKAIKKYGLLNFSFEILELCNTKELPEAEIFWISFFDSTNREIGYNIVSGGNSGPALRCENNPNSKLTEEDVFYIRECYLKLMNKRKVYEKYKDIISINTFADIWTGKTWKSVHYDVYTDETKYAHKHESSSAHHVRTVSKEDVIKIRDRKNDGDKHEDVYKDFSYININTFNDVWVGNTFKSEVSEKPIQPRPRRGCNSSLRFNEDEIISIKKRKKNGEKISDVYKEYSDRVGRSAFGKIWNNKSYKYIVV